MIVIFFLIPVSILIAIGFLLAFIWAVRSGQYEDTMTPAMRMLCEDRGSKPKAPDTLPAPTPHAPNPAQAKE